MIDGTLALGRQGTMQLTVENDGDLPATNVHLSATIPSPANLELFCNDGTAGPTCSVGTVPPGASRTFMVYGSSPKAGTWIADARAVASQANLNPDDAHTTFGFTVLPCTIVGTWGADILDGTKGPDRICGLPGPDRISGGPGNDYLNGGSGDDTIIGGDGHDTILGKGGRDVIYARDGRYDWIDCGTERDLAIVDRFDHFRIARRSCAAEPVDVGVALGDAEPRPSARLARAASLQVRFVPSRRSGEPSARMTCTWCTDASAWVSTSCRSSPMIVTSPTSSSSHSAR